MSRIESFRDLQVWNESMTLVEEVYDASRTFPSDERYGLTSQLRRAAVSVPCNIAEGSRRHHRRVLLHFLRVALGSQAEVEVQLEIALRLRLIDPARHTALNRRATSVGRMLNGLIASLSKLERSDKASG